MGRPDRRREDRLSDVGCAMTLKEYFEQGLTPKQYESLLGEQLELHRLHYRRAQPV